MRTGTLSFMRRMALRTSFACLWLFVLVNTPLVEVAWCVGAPPTLNDIVSTNLSIPFLANVGQLDQQVSFYARTLNGTAFVTTDGVIIYSFPPEEPGDGVAFIFEEQLVGAGVGPICGESSAKTRVSYFKGSDPEKWRNSVPGYKQVSFGNVYPGVSLALRAYANNIEKVFEISPGASVDAIRLAVGGVDRAAVNEDGQLVLSKDTREASFTRPLAYQVVAGDTLFVEAQYAVNGSEYSFEVGSYDRDRPLIIDPLIASTFLGGTQRESYYSKTPIVLDTSGNVYVASSTMSADFPATSGVYDNEFNGEKDVFVAQLDPGLTTVLAATFVGGSGGDSEVGDIALDAAGRLYVCGTTSAPDFPTTEDAYDRTLAGGNDAFVVCLNSDLSSLLASTFLGGADAPFGEHSYAIALGDSGEVFVAGYTDAQDFPATPGAYDETNPYGQDCFIARFNQGLSELVACTYLGGSGHDAQEDECIRGMQLGESGDVFVTGYTISSDFPIRPGAFDSTSNGNHDAFVASLDRDLSELNSATFFGGSGRDLPSDLAFGPDGTLYVTGWTSSNNFPTTPGAYDQAPNGSECDIFTSRFDPGLTTLVSSTYLGGRTYESWPSIEVASDFVYVAGTTNSKDFPTTADAFDINYNGTYWHEEFNDIWVFLFDAFVVRFDADLTRLDASTFLGGSSSDAAWPVGLALDIEGNVYVSGGTSSSDFPTNPDAYDVSFHGYIDAFVSVLDRDLSAGELRPMAVEIEKLDATTGKLSWGTVPNATHYDVYKSTTPFFAPVGAPWQTVQEPILSVEFTGGIGDEWENYYFIGRARNPTEQSAEWRIVGEHDFASSIPASVE